MIKLSMQALHRPTPQAYALQAKLPIIVLLDSVRSMHNVGSLFRTADALGIQAIYLCGYTPLPPHKDIHKTALGATETVPWQHMPNITNAIQAVTQAGYTVYAVEQTTTSIPLHQYTPTTQPTAIVLGNEVDGVSIPALALCHGAIEIPQLGTKHSFNVTVAAGIVLWKLAENHLLLNTQLHV